uniref:acylaminoacyl-peptidase n=1 Tax=Lates calcarifer TaxID=8187 RepID=A0A4W6C0E1_LATCA
SQNDLVRGSRLRYSQQWTLITNSNDQRSIRTVLPPGSCAPVSGDHGLRKCLNLTALNIHGRVYDDAQFGCLSWSECENKLLYVAEKSKNTSTETHDGDSACGKDRSVYCEDWGEALTNKSSSAICVVNLQNGSVSVLQGVPPQVSPGQALWSPGSQSVIFVGWYHEPFRLGLKFCSNRRSGLFRLDLDGHCECLSGDNLSVSCPRLSPDGSTLIYLQGRVFGPHNQCLSLQQVLCVCACVFSFMFLYLCVCSALSFFSGVLSFLHHFFHSIHTVFVVSLFCSLSSAGASDLSKVYGSWKLLTVQKDLMVVCCSSPNTPPTLRVGFLPSAGKAVTWQTLQQPVMTFNFHWTILDVTPPSEEDNTHYSGLDFGAVLVKPSHSLYDAKIPLVVFIHGGPHSQFPAEWNSTTAGLAKLGFAVLMVNYRGSTGFGQDSILSLIGQIGSQDVKDVQRAVLTALQGDLALDPKRLAVIGGSHGGFLSCHLVGQYPEFYRAYTCVHTITHPYIKHTTLAAMLEKSPITHAAQIKAPVLLMLGGRDRRVSPHQGLELYKALKSRASPVRLLWFAEDGHSLSRVDTQANCFLNIVLWLNQHL